MKTNIASKILPLAVIILFCSCIEDRRSPAISSPTESKFAPQPEAEIQKSDEGEVPARKGFQYGRSFLSPEARKAYDELYELAMAMQTGTRVALPQGYTQEETECLLRYFVEDNPELYWLTPFWITDTATGKRSAGFEIYNTLDKDAILARNGEISSAAARLLEGITGTAVEMVTELHDRLANHIIYSKRSGEFEIGNLYGGLVSGAGVCDAYAKTFQYLAGRLGIPCIYIRGTTNRGLTHAWNAVELEGSWYYLDVTWDDKEPLHHAYLNATSAEFDKEHYWDTSQYPRIPATTGERMDYYSLGGYTVEPGQEDSVSDKLASAFARQLLDRQPETGGEVFLEIKVLGDDREYERIKDHFFANIFDVLSRMNRILEEESADFRIADQNTVSCNYMDAMGLLMLFPAVEPTPSR